MKHLHAISALVLALFCASSVSADRKWMNYTPSTDFSGSQKNNEVSSLAVGSDGTVWCVAFPNVYRFDGATWRSVSEGNGTVPDHPSRLVLDRYGDLWVGSWSGIGRYDGISWKFFTTADGLFSNNHMYSRRRQRRYLERSRSSHGSRGTGSTWTNFLVDKNELYGVESIAVEPGGAVWIGFYSGGIYRFDGVAWTKMLEASGPIGIAQDGTIWVSAPARVSRLRNGTWTTYSTADGLADDEVNDIAIEPNGTAWFATRRGVSRFDGVSWTSWTVDNGLANDMGRSIAIAPDGTVWFGSEGGVSRLAADSLAVADEPALPKEYAVTGSHPNPFNPSTTISFTLPRGGDASLTVYNIAGQKVRTLISGFTAAGTHSAMWNGRDDSGRMVSSGVYIAHLRTGMPYQVARCFF